MKIVNFRRAVASALAAGGLLLSGSAALALTHAVGDPSFEQIGIGAPGFYYFQGPPNSPFWEKTHRGDPDFPGSGIGNNWAYTTDYATNTSPNKPDPIGDQAVHGLFAYNHQILSDTFESGRTYTYSLHVQGDGDAVGEDDSIWVYLFADPLPSLASGGLDNNSLAVVRFNQAGTTVVTGPATVGPFSGFNRSAGFAWTQVNLSYTATAADDGKKIGLAFWARRDAAIDDVALTSITTPGDYDGNGSVGLEDYDLWKSTYGDAIAAGADADGNRNGTIDAADYTVWRNNVPVVLGGGGVGVAAVPEPNSIALGFLAAGAAGLAAPRRRRD